MRLELQILDIRYALRSMRRSPLFAASVAATIGLGLGVLCSAFTILNAYMLAPIDLPNAQALYKLSWDTADARNRDFRLADFEAARESDSSGLRSVRRTAGPRSCRTAFSCPACW